MKRFVTCVAGLFSFLGLAIAALWLFTLLVHRPVTFNSNRLMTQVVVDRESFGIEHRFTRTVRSAPWVLPPEEAAKLPYTTDYFLDMPKPHRYWGFYFGTVEMIYSIRHDAAFTESLYGVERLGYVPNAICIPLLLALPLLLMGRHIARRHAVTSVGHCPICSYDLRAHAPGDKCPECGTPLREFSAQKKSAQSA